MVVMHIAAIAWSISDIKFTEKLSTVFHYNLLFITYEKSVH